MRKVGRLGRVQMSVLLAAGVVGGVGFQQSASATVLQCGDVVTTDTVLTADVGPCSGPGLIIGADDVTLDLGGRTVSGVCGTPGEGPGVWNRGYSMVKVVNGTVQCFDAGVVMEGLVTDGVTNSSDPAIRYSVRNEIKNLTVQDNVGGPGSDYGDGILLDNAADTEIKGNTVLRNGPYDGIGLIGASTRNKVEGNVITDNNIDQTPAFNQDDGIRLEPRTSFNIVTENVVSGSGLDGIAVFNPTAGNQVIGNITFNNGFHGKSGVRAGSGIFVFAPSQSDIRLNTVCGNAGNGIVVGGPAQGSALIADNTVGAGTPVAGTPAVASCAPNAVAGPLYFDLNDIRMSTMPPTPPGVPCLTNVWTNNYTPGDTFNHPCTTNP